jgi:hypothetical protein
MTPINADFHEHSCQLTHIFFAEVYALNKYIVQSLREEKANSKGIA